mgnify:CR=1 FL=1
MESNSSYHPIEEDVKLEKKVSIALDKPTAIGPVFELIDEHDPL